MRLDPFVQVADQDVVEIIALGGKSESPQLVECEVLGKLDCSMLCYTENQVHGVGVIIGKIDSRRLPRSNIMRRLVI